jgi:hypothetical protein
MSPFSTFSPPRDCQVLRVWTALRILHLAACPDTGLNLDIIGEVLYLVSG